MHTVVFAEEKPQELKVNVRWEKREDGNAASIAVFPSSISSDPELVERACSFRIGTEVEALHNLELSGLGVTSKGLRGRVTGTRVSRHDAGVLLVQVNWNRQAAHLLQWHCTANSELLKIVTKTESSATPEKSLVCVVCGACKPSGEFSATQRKKRAHERRCAVCAQSGAA